MSEKTIKKTLLKGWRTLLIVTVFLISLAFVSGCCPYHRKCCDGYYKKHGANCMKAKYKKCCCPDCKAGKRCEGCMCGCAAKDKTMDKAPDAGMK